MKALITGASSGIGLEVGYSFILYGALLNISSIWLYVAL